MNLDKLKPGWIYETLITTKRDTVNCAPFGIWHNQRGIHVKIYMGSATLENILETGFWCVNFPTDEESFYKSLFQPGEFKFDEKPAEVPAIKGMPYLLCELSEKKNQGDSYLLTGKITQGRGLEKMRLFNRASNLLLESLILFTKRKHLPEKYLLETLKENQRVMEKVAPGSRYPEMMDSLLRKI